MEANALRESCVEDIVIPEVVVELQHLQTSDGQPVRVRCRRPDVLVLTESIGALPGLRPDGGAGSISDEAAVQATMRISPALIESATSFLAADGSAVRPAFYFGEKSPDPRSLPGSVLHPADRIVLVTAILKIGGYAGVASSAEQFPGANGAGADGGGGAVEGGVGGGEVPQ